MDKLLLLSGASGAGKSSVAKELEESFQFRRISSSTYLRSYAQALDPCGEKHQLQELGDRLDEETDFAWVIDDVAAPAIESDPQQPSWLVDAVRKPRQVQRFRRRFGRYVRHVHLSAPEAILEARYAAQAKPEDTLYAEVIAHPNEVAARALERDADQVFDTSQLSPAKIAQSILLLWSSEA